MCSRTSSGLAEPPLRLVHAVGAEMGRAGGETKRPGAEMGRAGGETKRPGAEMGRAGSDMKGPGAEMGWPGGETREQRRMPVLIKEQPI